MKYVYITSMSMSAQILLYGSQHNLKASYQAEIGWLTRHASDLRNTYTLSTTRDAQLVSIAKRMQFLNTKIDAITIESYKQKIG